MNAVCKKSHTDLRNCIIYYQANYLCFYAQNANVSAKAAYFRGKGFLLVHGTADGLLTSLLFSYYLSLLMHCSNPRFVEILLLEEVKMGSGG